MKIPFLLSSGLTLLLATCGLATATAQSSQTAYLFTSFRETVTACISPGAATPCIGPTSGAFS